MSHDNIEGFYPLSPTQQGMLFHSLFAPETGVYVIQSPLGLVGDLQLPAWEAAWTDIFRRHGVLRTFFISDEVKEPVQVVRREVSLPLTVHDWTEFPEEERERRLRELLHRDKHEGFNLSQPPLVRLTLIRTGEQNYTFVFTAHHLLLDGWSLGLLFKEMFALYEGYVQDTKVELAPVSPFRDHVAWLRKQDLQKAETFWRKSLEGFTTPTPITFGKNETAEDHFSLELNEELSEGLTAELQAFSRKNRITLNTLIQGAWAILLSRNSGEEDVLFGAVVTGRPAHLPKVQTMIGMFINTLPVRVKASGSEPVVAWLRAFQAYQTELREYEYSPLTQVQQWNGLPKGSRLFDTIVVFQSYPADTSVENKVGNLSLESAVESVQQTGYPLTVVAMPGERLKMKIIYSQERFEAVEIGRLYRQFITILEGLVRSQGRLADLPSLGKADTQLVLEEWNATSTPFPVAGAAIHRLVQKQAERIPEQVAVAGGGTKLTYRELDLRSNQLARLLTESGAGPGSIVGVCAERSPELVVSLLGILKAGAAYVPLDPEYPKERLRFILEDTQVPILLTQPHLRGRLPDLPIRAVELDSRWEPLVEVSGEAVSVAVSSDDLAYVIYTSGSTGLPKGVEITHQALLNLVFWHQQTYEVTEADRATLIAGPAFDASVWETWPYLAAGAGLYIPDEETRLTPDRLRDWLLAHSITLSFLPTPLAERLITLPWPQEASLRFMLTGGDKLHRYPDQPLPFTLVNHYGPTENTVVSTCAAVPAGTAITEAPPIGRPVANTLCYILDHHGQPVPVGVTGQLYVAGASLARGYFNKPELTAERFVRDPFAAVEGSERCMYATGDLCRYLEDGQIEYVGRVDDQVKIRGFRIELGEIETLLALHPHVREAIALVREMKAGAAAGDKRLLAYVTLAEGATEKVEEELREHAKERLPDYMVPSAFVVLEALPLTPNGKVDRKALPEYKWQTEADSFVAPRTDEEQKLADIWSGVLDVERVGIHDNYFQLGGDSILSIQIVSRARKQGLQLTPKQLFQNPTIAELALAVGKARQAEAEQGLVTGAVPLTPIQSWFFEQRYNNRNHFNQSLFLSVPEDANADALREAVGYLLRHHDALRLTYKQGPEGWEQTNAGWTEAEAIPYAVVDLSHLSEEELTGALEQGAESAQQSLVLEDGMLFKAVYFQLGVQRRGRLLLVVHHLAVDGVSWRILLEDLHSIYQALLNEREVELPAKTTSFQEWSLKLTDYASSPQAKEEFTYWSRQDFMQASTLPVDRMEGPNSVESSREIVTMLSPEETHAFLHEVPQVYRTQMNDVLLTALGRALARWSGADRQLIHLEGHGREEIIEGVDISRTVGWFTSMFPFLLKTEGCGDIGRDLKTVKEALRLIPDRGIGYGLLRYLTKDEEITAWGARQPKAEISFNYLGQFDQVVDSSEDALFGPASERTGCDQDPQAVRAHLLDVGGILTGGSLHLTWVYSENRHEAATVQKLADLYIDELRTIIAHCAEPLSGGVTPSDFPLARLSQEQLDGVYAADRQLQDIFPLAPMQEGMLFHSLELPNSGLYCEQSVFTFQGPFYTDAFKSAWRQVMDRHSILRTRVEWKGLDRPHLILSEHPPLDVTELDWRSLPAGERKVLLAQFLEEDRRRGFDFERSALMRFTLIRLEDGLLQFVWTFHHLLLDGWSSPIVVQEFFALFEAESQGRSVRLQPARSFRDYIAWLSQQNKAEAESFWRGYLQGIEEATAVPADLSPGGEEAVYEEIKQNLPVALTDRLQAFARKHQLTVNTLVQGAWAILLSRYTGQTDVMFGVTVSGRPADLEGVESIVGLFINTLPVRVRPEAQANVLAYLKHLQEVQMDQRQYEYASLSELHGWSDVPRGNPLFESIVVYENYPVQIQDETAATEALEAAEKPELLEIESFERTNYPLTVTAFPGPTLELRLTYDRNRYSETVIRRMIVHLERLLEGLQADDSKSIGSLRMLTEEEEYLLLHEWSKILGDYPKNARVHELFEAQAKLTPDAVALVLESELLTYRELDAKANRLARYLRDKGVGPQVPVGIATERSLETVIGLLAILKAGGAYVPLDPDYPSDRLELMLEDNRVTVLLTQESVVDRLPVSVADVILLDRDAAQIAGQSDEPLTVPGSAEDLAYVIYTSGSTGRPKGVAVPHRGIVRLALGMQFARFGAGEVMLQFAPISFDASTFEVWGALLNGGTLAIMPPGLPSAEELGGKLHDYGVTTAWLTAPLFHTMVEENLAALTGLKQLWAGGDALSVPHVGKALATGSLELINGYGPTESTTFTCCYPMSTLPEATGSIPIGRPIPGTQVYVLNASRELSPIGVPGELYIGGDGLALGYVNLPELTAEHFVPHPLVPGERLYRTGDLVRYLPDGQIEFLGRLDHQVKIRGFRIEPGEIEKKLSEHPKVGQAVVVARSENSGEKRLVAYAVLQEAGSTSEKELHAYLKELLPDYMVPSVVMILDNWPLLSSGKVDRKALPAPVFASQEGYAAPVTEEERILADIWAQVLGVEHVGLYDNFFELGGDSILSIQIVARAAQQGLKLTPKQLFQHRTIAELATVVEKSAAPQAEQDLVTGELPLTPVQRWFFELPLVNRDHWNQSVMLLGNEPVDAGLLRETFRHLLNRHDALRMRYIRRGDAWIQVNEGESDDVPFERFDLSALPEAEQSTVIEETAAKLQSALNIEEGPLVRAALFDLGPAARARLFIVAHHLVVDGVSWRILLEDLESFYSQLADKGDVQPLPKTTSFQQWARLLEAEASSGAFRKELDYWNKIADAWVSPFPLDYPADPGQFAELNTIESADDVIVTLSATDTQTLLQDVPAVYRTRIDEVLLTALAAALESWTGSSQLLLHLEGHGREDIIEEADLSRTVGWFTSIYPVLIDLGFEPSVSSRLMAVKEQLRGIPNRGIGYGMLRYFDEETLLSQKLAPLPPIEISYNYLGQMGSSQQSAGRFSTAPETGGLSLDPANSREHLLDVAGLIADNHLRMTFTFSRQLHRKATIQQIADDFKAALHEIIAGSRQSAEDSHFTPSDFAEAGLNQKELDLILAKISGGRNNKQ
ncbi:Linear gramicidin synthase subunit D [compost metagenome]